MDRPFLHTYISYTNRVHVCKKGGPLFERLQFDDEIQNHEDLQYLKRMTLISAKE